MSTDKRSRDLTRAFPGDPDRLSLLRDRLAATAQQNRILDIAYRAIDSPVGPLPIAATEPGLIRVAHAREGHDAVLQALAGHRHSFDLPWTWRLAAGFRRVVLSRLPDIGYGHIASYAAIARLVGHPKAVRAAAPPARPTRCRWCCPATVLCTPTAAGAATSAAPTPSAPPLTPEAAA